MSKFLPILNNLPNLKPNISFPSSVSLDTLSSFYNDTILSNIDLSFLPNFGKSVPYPLALGLGFLALVFFSISVLCLLACFCRCRPSKKKFHYKPMDHNLNDFNARKLQQYKDIPNKDYGVIHYSFDYNLNKSILTVGVKKLEGLPEIKLSRIINPFITVRLFPDLQTQQTTVARFTRNPIYNEVFDFSLTLKKQKKAIVIFSVYAHRIFKRPYKISQLNVPLQNITLGELIEDYDALQEPTLNEEDTGVGELCLSLRYIPSLETLNIIVIEAKDLKPLDDSFKDPYVKIYMYVNNEIVKKKKTKTRSLSDINPYFNESFNFDINPRFIHKTELLVKVSFKKRLKFMSKNIGEFYVSGSKLGTGLKHWLEVTGKPGYPLAMWHTILPC